jgi:lysophospholipase L1-like esterase
MLGLKVNGVDAMAIPAGVSGNMSNNMLGRLQSDVLDTKPNWMLISCGVNDVWHTPGGVPLPDFKHNMTEIVSRAQAKGIKVMILTATMIGENANNLFNRKLVAYNAFLRRLAARRHCLLADVGADMRTQVKKEIAKGRQAGCLFTVDGVHPNPRGNMMMAADILKAFGCNHTQLSKARRAWLNVHWTLSVVYQIRVTRQLTLSQFLRLQKQGHKNTSAAIWDQVQSWFAGYLNAMPAVQHFDERVQHLFNMYIHHKLRAMGKR